MDAIYQDTHPRMQGASRPRRFRHHARAVAVAVAHFVAESARGDDFNRHFDSPSDAQFAQLPRTQQDRLLNRGCRP